jgi:hypothetical protein
LLSVTSRRDNLIELMREYRVIHRVRTDGKTVLRGMLATPPPS